MVEGEKRSREKEEGRKTTRKALADFFLREFCDNIKEVGASWLGAIQMKKIEWRRIEAIAAARQAAARPGRKNR